MASKKLPDHVHCAKCGYRGIDQNHDCTAVRAATAAVIEQATRRGIPGVTSQPQRLGPTMEELETPLSVATQLIRLGFEHGRLFGRHVTYVDSHHVGNPYGTLPIIEIQQRCACCCGDINKRVAIDTSQAFFGLELGAAARKAYLQHRCPPVSDSLIGFTYEELEELHQALERDADLMLERVAQIVELQKARPR